MVDISSIAPPGGGDCHLNTAQVLDDIGIWNNPRASNCHRAENKLQMQTGQGEQNQQELVIAQVQNPVPRQNDDPRNALTRAERDVVDGFRPNQPAADRAAALNGLQAHLRGLLSRDRRDPTVVIQEALDHLNPALVRAGVYFHVGTRPADNAIMIGNVTTEGGERVIVPGRR